jgi:hypothetical protein
MDRKRSRHLQHPVPHWPLQTHCGLPARQVSLESPLVPRGLVSHLYPLWGGGFGEHRAELA